MSNFQKWLESEWMSSVLKYSLKSSVVVESMIVFLVLWHSNLQEKQNKTLFCSLLTSRSYSEHKWATSSPLFIQSTEQSSDLSHGHCPHSFGYVLARHSSPRMICVLYFKKNISNGCLCLKMGITITLSVTLLPTFLYLIKA